MISCFIGGTVMPSVFSKILKREVPGYILDEDEHFFAILDINPVNPGHTLVIPKREVDYLFDLPEDLYQGIFLFSRRLSTALKRASGAKRIGLAVEGFSIPHAHIHLIPINSQNELNPQRARRATPQELQGMFEKILCALGKHEVERIYLSPETAKSIGKMHLTACRRCKAELDT